MQMEWDYILSVVLTGLTVVFVVLILLVGFVWAFGKLFSMNKTPKTPKGPKVEKTLQAKEVENVNGSPIIEDGISDEVIAVISAAIAAMSSNSEGTTLKIRSIKRTNNGRSAWALAGLQENTRAF